MVLPEGEMLYSFLAQARCGVTFSIPSIMFALFRPSLSLAVTRIPESCSRIYPPPSPQLRRTSCTCIAKRAISFFPRRLASKSAVILLQYKHGGQTATLPFCFERFICVIVITLPPLRLNHVSSCTVTCDGCETPEPLYCTSFDCPYGFIHVPYAANVPCEDSGCAFERCCYCGEQNQACNESRSGTKCPCKRVVIVDCFSHQKLMGCYCGVSAVLASIGGLRAATDTDNSPETLYGNCIQSDFDQIRPTSVHVSTHGLCPNASAGPFKRVALIHPIYNPDPSFFCSSPSGNSDPEVA